MPTLTECELTDAVDGTGVVIGSGEVDVSSPGVYVLSFDYTDAAGNSAAKLRIEVIDSTGQSLFSMATSIIPTKPALLTLMPMPPGATHWMGRALCMEWICKCKHSRYLLVEIRFYGRGG